MPSASSTIFGRTSRSRRTRCSSAQP
jgi:hypothetical protein